MAFPNLELGCLFQNILPGALTNKLFQAVSTVLWYLSFSELFQTLPGEFLSIKIRLEEGIHCICKGGKPLVMPPMLLPLGHDGICLDTPKISFLADAFVIIEDRQGPQLIGNVGLAIFTTLQASLPVAAWPCPPALSSLVWLTAQTRARPPGICGAAFPARSCSCR